MEEGCSTQPCPVLPKSGSADPSPDSLGNHFLGGPTLLRLFCDPKDCNPPGPSVHGISQAGILEWVAISFSKGIFLTQGSNMSLLHYRHILYH